MSLPFSDADIATLRALWDEGRSTIAIGRLMHRSKNSVVGKVHRLDLADRPSPIKRRDPSAPPVVREPRVAPPLPPLASLRIPLTHRQNASIGRRPPQPAPNVVQLRLPIAAPRACQYPLWGALHADDRPVFARMCDDPRPGVSPRFCGGAAAEKSSYCTTHHDLVYRKVRDAA